ncbi:MAG: prepilin-type N-terminal cleavage/methylation domain-containing protein [bacterium]
MRTEESGFTLLELLLALLILSLIMAVIAGAVNLAVKSWDAGDRLSLRNQRIRMTLNQIGDEIRSIQPLSVLMENDKEEKLKNKGFVGTGDSVTFLTSTMGLTKNSRTRRLRAVCYRLEGSEGLIAYESTLDFRDFFEDPEAGQRLVLNPEVTSLSFRYLYVPPEKKGGKGDQEEELSPQWLTNWDPSDIESNDIIEDNKGKEISFYTQVPKAVEITIKVSGNKSEIELPALVLPVYAGQVIKAK